jgi:hypothetical protein
MKVFQVGAELVLDLGEREIVEGVDAARVCRLATARISAFEIDGEFAWIPVSDLVRPVEH